MQTKLNLRLGVLALIVLAAAMSRLLPHPPNATAVGAMALFGGAYFSQRWQSVLVPLVAMWLSDLVLNNVVYKAYNPNFTFFTEGSILIYGSIALIAVLGWTLLKKVKMLNVIGASLLGSVAFFLISNFGVWLYSTMYPQSIAGLMTCYAAGLPFLMNTVLGDMVWCAVLFGGFELAQQRVSVLARH
jgi:prepilin signal peptidase PulO-like enzyme (type II secretory pathway)